MASLEFNDDEVTIILCLADLRENCEVNRFSTDAIVRKSGMDPHFVGDTLNRLKNYGVLQFEDSGDASISINLTIFEYRDQIQNPPLPNHWKSLSAWWFSKRWTLPVTVVVVALPLVTQWIEMLKTLVGWLRSE